MPMEIIFLRHAPAVDKAAWAKTDRPDADRPLTPAGKRKAKAAAEGLAAVLGRVRLVATSPWKRAKQTAAPAAAALRAKTIETPLLTPEHSPEALAKWLRSLGAARVVLVGHEPHMSAAASWLLTGGVRPVVALKKAQALLLDCGEPGAGTATLVWSLPPAALRRLG